MKKYFWIFLLLPSLCFGATGDLESIGGKVDTAITSIAGKAGTSIATILGKNYTDGDAASPCPSGTSYLSAWDGDYTSDTDKMCYNSKASQIDGTLSGGTLSTDYGESGSVGLLADAGNEYLTWTNTSSVLLDESEGTICVRAYLNATSYTNFTQLMEVTPGETVSEQRIRLYFQSNGSIKVETEDDVGTEFYVNTSPAMNYQTWATIKYTWLTGTTTEGKHKICIDATCTEDTGDDITAITGLTNITLGERYTNQSMTHPLWVNSLKIYNTYDATCE